MIRESFKEQMKDYGNLPILLKTGEFSMEIKRNSGDKPMHLYALDLTGKRIAELPFEQSENSIAFSVFGFLPSLFLLGISMPLSRIFLFPLVTPK